MNNPPAKPPASGVLTGAAFLMAVSAIGPGFLTQTTQFTAQLGASLAFAILISVVIDVGAQLNTWRVVCVSGRRGQEIAGAVVPGLGWIVTAAIVAGSFVFNLGNFSGCGLGLEALLRLPPAWGMAVSAAVAVGLFLLPRALAAMDWFSKLLGAGMIALMLYVVFITRPPLATSVWPIMKREASDNRKCTTSATSSDWPMRFMGVSCTIRDSVSLPTS